MFNYVPIKHKQMSFLSNGGKFKFYTVLNGLIFPTPTQLRILFERAILLINLFVVVIFLWFYVKETILSYLIKIMYVIKSKYLCVFHSKVCSKFFDLRKIYYVSFNWKITVW
jgi:hypothetical protein